MSKSKKNGTNEREYWRDQVDQIREDSVHGSVHLSDEALNVIEEYIQREEYRNRTELIQNLSKLSNALVRAKPLMALIYSRAHRLIGFIQSYDKEERNVKVIKKAVLGEIAKIRKEAEEKSRLITRFGARLILDQHVVLVHSASSIVESILRQAKQKKKRFRLICTESRPLLEGTKLATRMARAGIKTRLIPDADIGRALQDAHFALTGTDRITENTFINKTGTAAMAIVAKEYNKPFYIAADSDKILLKRTYPTRFHSVHEYEILKKPPQNLSVENYYFEEIPLEYLHKIICEVGIFERDEFIDRFL